MYRRSQHEVVRDQVIESARHQTVGTVLTVDEHASPDDDSNHYVNVLLRDGGKEFRQIPVASRRFGSIYVPQVGDLVVVSFLDGITTAPLVTDVLHASGDRRAPLGREGHWRHRFGTDGDMFVEAEPVDHSGGHAETVRLAVKADGLSDPTARIEIDGSGSDPVIRITRGESEQGNTDMGLELDFGTGKFKLGDGSGYGIVSDGNGNFDWYENSVNFVDDGSTIPW